MRACETGSTLEMTDVSCRLPVPALVACLLLTACSEPQLRQAEVVAPAAAPHAVDLLAEVRAAGADAGDVVEVAPLRETSVQDFVHEAVRAEAASDYRAAALALRQALSLSADDPELLQHSAEMQLALGVFDEAERLAARSFEKGPRLGGLCRRNWATVRLARDAVGDGAGADRAAQQLTQCVVMPPVRM